jgi:Alphavirus glycoprotein J
VSGTKANSTETGSKGGSSQGGHNSNADNGTGAGSGDPLGSVKTQNTNNSVPQIAADSAGDSWLPFFIGGMVALACAAAALIYRNRRRTAQS